MAGGQEMSKEFDITDRSTWEKQVEVNGSQVSVPVDQVPAILGQLMNATN